MLFLQFQGGNDRYVIATRDVVEVVPLVSFKKIPQAPSYVSGVFNYHTKPVPAIDLTELLHGQPSRQWMSTRIIVVKYVVNYRSNQSEERLLGLLAEKVMETLRIADDQFTDPGVASPDARYLGPVATLAGNIVQLVDAGRILNEDVRSLLFREPGQ